MKIAFCLLELENNLRLAASNNNEGEVEGLLPAISYIKNKVHKDPVALKSYLNISINRWSDSTEIRHGMCVYLGKQLDRYLIGELDKCIEQIEKILAIKDSSGYLTSSYDLKVISGLKSSIFTMKIYQKIT